MLAAGGRPAGYDDPENGSSCPLQLVFGWFHSLPLFELQKYHIIPFS